MRRFSSAFALFTITALLAGSFGCAAIARAGRRNQFIQQKMSGYVFQKPIAQVWPLARQMLFEDGYTVRDSDTGDGSHSLETEWKYDGQGQGSRYLATGSKLSDTTCQVQFMESSGNHNNSSSSRDYRAELKLLQRVDPTAAAQIDGEADVYANQQ